MFWPRLRRGVTSLWPNVIPVHGNGWSEFVLFHVPMILLSFVAETERVDGSYATFRDRRTVYSRRIHRHTYYIAVPPSGIHPSVQTGPASEVTCHSVQS
jgi:hypothetical protein